MNESSSSDATVPSWPPNEILDLGDQLVRELGLQDSTDTLGRWMAHHLADLIVSARSFEGEARSEAEALACDLVLRLWANRPALPGRAYPLARWGSLLAVLRLLDSPTSPFGRRQSRALDLLLGQAFDGLRTLVKQGLVLAHPADSVRGSGNISGFLEPDEAEVAKVLDRWEAHFEQAYRPSGIEILLASMGEEAAPDEPGPLDAAQSARLQLVAQIDELLDTLGSLKTHLEQGLPADEDEDNEAG